LPRLVDHRLLRLGRLLPGHGGTGRLRVAGVHESSRQSTSRIVPPFRGNGPPASFLQSRNRTMAEGDPRAEGSRGLRGRPSPPPQTAPVEPASLPLRTGWFAVVGDLQPSSGFEVWRESNPKERRAILREVSEEKPDFVALLGDLVFCGSSAAAWTDFDRLCTPLKRS